MKELELPLCASGVEALTGAMLQGLEFPSPGWQGSCKG